MDTQNEYQMFAAAEKMDPRGMPFRRSPLFYDCLAAEHKRTAFDVCVSEPIALRRKGPMGKTGQIAGA
jgi:hypothetical protein